jgi:hypothetical protein
MEGNERTKLCPNCDGSVAIEVSICPYCGSSVFQANNSHSLKNKDDSIKSLSAKETLESLYPPPYRPKSFDKPNKEEKPGNGDDDDDDPAEPDEDSDDHEGEEEDIDDVKNSGLIPTMLFWIGVNIFVFAIILLLFSKDGQLHLKWNASYWYMYAIVGIPLVYFGYNGIKKLD